jgi:hypothetical protein
LGAGRPIETGSMIDQCCGLSIVACAPSQCSCGLASMSGTTTIHNPDPAGMSPVPLIIGQRGTWSPVLGSRNAIELAEMLADGSDEPGARDCAQYDRYRSCGEYAQHDEPAGRQRENGAGRADGREDDGDDRP